MRGAIGIFVSPFAFMPESLVEWWEFAATFHQVLLFCALQTFLSHLYAGHNPRFFSKSMMGANASGQARG
jgi:hypothetical protein